MFDFGVLIQICLTSRGGKFPRETTRSSEALDGVFTGMFASSTKYFGIRLAEEFILRSNSGLFGFLFAIMVYILARQ